jgi:thiol-disulfide isomerase/thioredoxin
MYSSDELQLKAENLQVSLLSAEDSSSSDIFSRVNFSHIIESHDFTFVYFYSEWCDHSRQFHPIWDQLVDSVSEKMQFPNEEGRPVTVPLLRMNCGDFRDACQNLEIQSFPTLRLFRREGTFTTTSGRSSNDVISFLRSSVAGVAKDDHIPVGCAASGLLHVPRVQGSLHVTVGPSITFKQGPASSPNPDVIDMSHHVTGFHFGDSDATFSTYHRMLVLIKENVPSDVLERITQLDGKSFFAERANTEHYLKVVSTGIGKKKDFYQITHSNRVRSTGSFPEKHTVPSARFNYDFSPLRVVLHKTSKPWYEFLTSFTAILGGTYAVMQFCGRAADNLYSKANEATRVA